MSDCEGTDYGQRERKEYQTVGQALGNSIGPEQPLRPNAQHYSVTIDKVENGFIVRVGCKTFVSTSFSELLAALDLYYRDPEAAAMRYLRPNK